MADQVVTVELRARESGLSQSADKAATALDNAADSADKATAALNREGQAARNAAGAGAAAATANRSNAQASGAAAQASNTAADAAESQGDATRESGRAADQHARSSRNLSAVNSEVARASRAAAAQAIRQAQAQAQVTAQTARSAGPIRITAAHVAQLAQENQAAVRSQQAIQAAQDRSTATQAAAAERTRNLAAAQRDQAAAADTAGRSNGLLSRTLEGLRGVIAGVTLGVLASQAAQTADSFTNLEARTRLALGTQVQTDRALDQSVATAQRYGVQIDTLANFQARLATNSARLAQDQQSLEAVTNTVSAALAINGATSAEAASTMLQLSQSFGAGVLNGQEFNAIAENASPLLALLVEASGRTREELRELSAAGALTTDVLIKAFTGPGAERLRQGAEELPNTLDRATQRFKNQLVTLVADTERSLGIVAGIASAVTAVGNNLQPLIAVIAAISTVILSRLVASLVASAGAWLANTQQIIAYQIALARYQGVSAAAAVSQLALNRALSLFGGPLGLALTLIGLVGVALLQYSDSQSQVARATQIATEATQALTQAQGPAIFASLETAKQKRDEAAATLQSAQAVLAELRAKDEAERRNRNRNPLGLTAGLAGFQAGQQEQEIQRLQAALNDLNGAVSDGEARYKTFLETLNNTGVTKTAEDAVKKITDALNSQRLALTEQLVELVAGEDALLTYQRAQALAAAETDAHRQVINEQFDAIEELVRGIRFLTDQQREQEQAEREIADTARDVAQAYRANLQTINPLLVLEQQHAQQLQQIAILAALSDQELAKLGLTQEQLAQAVAAANEAFNKQRTAIQDDADAVTDAILSIRDNGVRSLSDALGDFFARGLSNFSDFGRSLLNIGRQIVSDLVSLFAQRALIGPLTQSLAGLFGGSGATPGIAGGPGAGGGGFSGLLSLLAGAGLGAGASSLAGGGALSGAIGGGIGQLLTTTIFESAFASLGKFAGPIGSVIGGFIGGALGKLFGKSPRIQLGGERSGITPDDKTDRAFVTDLGVVLAELRKQSVETLNALVQGVTSVDNAIAAALDPARLPGLVEALKDFDISLKGKSITVEDAIRERVRFVVNALGNDIATAVGNLSGDLEAVVQRLTDVLAIDQLRGDNLLGIDRTVTEIVNVLEELSIGSETLGQAYQRLAIQTAVYADALAAVGIESQLTGEALVRFTDELVAQVGGLDRLRQQLGSILAAFFDPVELLQIQSDRARGNAADALAELGLNIEDLSRETFGEALRAALNSDLAPDALALWLAAGEAYANYLALEEELARQRGETAEATAEAIAAAEAEAEAQRQAEEAARMAAEAAEQAARLLEEAAREQERLAEAERRRVADLGELLGRVQDDIDAETLSQYAIQLRDINRRYAEDTAAAIALGASEEQLALIRERHQLQLEALSNRLRGSLADLSQQFTGGLGGGFTDGISQGLAGVGAQARDLFGEWETALGNIADAVRDIQTDPRLSGLEGQARLDQAQANFDALIAAANAGDINAAQQIPAALRDLANLAVEVQASGSDSQAIIQAAIAAAQGVQRPGNVQAQSPNAGQVANIQTATESIAARAQQQVELALQIIDQLALAAQLSEDNALQIAEQLGIPLREVVQALGVDVAAPTQESVRQLGLIAEQLNVGLLDLANQIGLDIGTLSDAGGLFNSAVRDAINALGPDVSGRLLPALSALEEAAGPEAQAAALANLESLIAELTPDLRNALAPFFEGIATTSEAQQQTDALSQIRDHALAQIQAMQRVADLLESVRQNLAEQNTTSGIASYRLGTDYVPRDGLYTLHRGERVVPSRTNAQLRLGETGGGTSLDDTEARRLLARLVALTEQGNRNETRYSDRVTGSLSGLAGSFDSLAEKRRMGDLAQSSQNARGKCRA